ncbi:hypothetical protein I302_101967 [Kwoniella bestiolae CBS 10118]|uniref:Uncharacterized protein n=1 Tax=Kwoniella bestiolae CBS 10118 TaxID=1296100 RepID=A0A1B9GDV1_9TREE|nr:hypothetical protein I302_00650 [Kwoniella bestiolae CBS 10118]OCF29155.1 hypothetical protein I302_00650 [Kwoniella bestiolae CBS 10118]
MDRQLKSPLLIEPIGPSTKLTPEVTYQHLLNFLEHSSLGTNGVSKIQLERLTDALGVSIGKIDTAEEELREVQRREEKERRKAERRRLRAQAEEEKNRENLEGMVEGLEGGEGEMESGAVGFDDVDASEKQMDDRGEVEYGDVVQEDEDEPDNEDQGEGEVQDEDEKMEEESN